MTRVLLTAIATLLLSLTANAHEPDKGPNGGRRVDAGDYHVELVTENMAVTAYLSDDKYNPVDAAGFRATGVFVIAGKPQRIELKPDAANRLTGASPAVGLGAIKGALQITRPDGKTVQAKFE